MWNNSAWKKGQTVNQKRSWPTEILPTLQPIDWSIEKQNLQEHKSETVQLEHRRARE